MLKVQVRHDDGQHAGRDQKVMSEIFLTRLLATKVRFTTREVCF